MTKKKLEDKTIEELTPEDCSKLKIEFAPGAFDEFDGTQEELDELIANLTKMIHSGELFEQSRTVDLESLIEEDPEIAQRILSSVNTETRFLQ
jgi:hypothetical protein